MSLFLSHHLPGDACLSFFWFWDKQSGGRLCGEGLGKRRADKRHREHVASQIRPAGAEWGVLSKATEQAPGELKLTRTRSPDLPRLCLPPSKAEGLT